MRIKRRLRATSVERVASAWADGGFTAGLQKMETALSIIATRKPRIAPLRTAA